MREEGIDDVGGSLSPADTTANSNTEAAVSPNHNTAPTDEQTLHSPVGAAVSIPPWVVRGSAEAEAEAEARDESRGEPPRGESRGEPPRDEPPRGESRGEPPRGESRGEPPRGESRGEPAEETKPRPTERRESSVGVLPSFLKSNSKSTRGGGGGSGAASAAMAPLGGGRVSCSSTGSEGGGARRRGKRRLKKAPLPDKGSSPPLSLLPQPEKAPPSREGPSQ